MVISGRSPPTSVGLQPNIEENDTPKPAIMHSPSKQLNMKNEDTDQLCIQSCLCMDGQTYHSFPGPAVAFKPVLKCSVSLQVCAETPCSWGLVVANEEIKPTT